jgi:hypothetical protein
VEKEFLTPSSLPRASCCYTRGMPRFVLLYHECPPEYARSSHWDLMLEVGEVLRTWAVAKLPRSWRAAWEKTAELYPDCPVLADFNLVAAEPLGDHRLAYLNEEGPLSGDRGSVRRIDSGTYEGEDPLMVQGQLIQGRVYLRRDTSPPGWMLIVDRDLGTQMTPGPTHPHPGALPKGEGV